MKYKIIDYTNNDDDNDVLFETDRKEEIDSFIELNLECSEFLGFYWENNRMVINTTNYDVVIEE